MHTEYLQGKRMMLRFCVKILWGKERKGREKLSSGGTDETILAVMVTAEAT